MWFCGPGQYYLGRVFLDFLEVILNGPDAWQADHWNFVVAGLAVVIGLFAWISGALSRLWQLLVWLWSRLRPRAPVMIGVPHGQREIVGRQSHLKDLREGLRNCGAVAVHGAGGQGKSTLARHYVEQYGRSYKGVLHVVAETETALVGGLLALKPTLKLDLRDMPETAAARSLLAALPEHGRWLLIYDNVPDLAEIKDLRPPKGVDLIVTTRAGAGWDGFAKVAPGVLPFGKEEDPAVRLLMREAGRREDAAGARALAEALGGLPLALVVAGALIRETGESFDSYRARVDEIIAHVPVNSDYPDSVAGAVRLTYARLSADAQALADLCAWLAPEGLTEALFAGAVKAETWESRERPEVVDDLAQVLEDPARLRAGLQEMRRWSVLSDEYGMHRLTQAVLRGAQTEEGRAFACARGAAAVLAAQFPFDSDYVVNWEDCRALLPHVRALWAAAEWPWRGRWGKPDWADMDYLLNQVGVFLSRQEDRNGAISLSWASLELKETRLGEDRREIPLALGNLAQQLAEGGALSEAQDMIDRAVRLDEAHREGVHRTDLAARYMQQAAVAIRRLEAGGEIAEGAAGEADAALEKAGEIREAMFGAQSAEMAEVWNQTGFLRRVQGRKILERKAYLRAREIGRELDAPDPAILAMQAMNSGVVLLELGWPEDGRTELLEAYELAREIFATHQDHPFYVATRRWLTACLLVLARKGDSEARREAEALCARHGLELAELEAGATRFPLEPMVEG